MSNTIDFDLYSDLYKELNGFRPRSMPSQAVYDSFLASYDELFQQEQAQRRKAEVKAIAGANAALGTNFESIDDLDKALEVERDMDRYDIILDWLTSY